MKKRDLIEVMRRLYDDTECYAELWKAVHVLVNLGLLDDSFIETIAKTDSKLFAESNQ